MKRKIPLIFLCVILFFSCRRSSEPAVSGESSRVAAVQAHQIEKIAEIAEDARDTLPGFFRHLNRRDTEDDYFCVKYPFAADDDSGISGEQLWLTGIHFKNGIYYGVLANNPRHLSGMKKGDTVMFDMDGVTDWMYVRSGRIIGGDSIKYLLEEIPQHQLSDNEYNLLRMLH